MLFFLFLLGALGVAMIVVAVAIALDDAYTRHIEEEAANGPFPGIPLM
ncbi:hypothetical protein [Caldimonas tepidiphila]|nr:hypothetical protein [Caldimonas tepidiphila]